MIELRKLSRTELEALVSDAGEPSYRAAQLFRWIHRSGAFDVAAMTNLGRALRERLSSTATLAPLLVDLRQVASDGTEKLRLKTHDGAFIESVLIPDGDKLTLCISSQVGCALDCAFCATALMGFGRHLSAGEIVDQVYRARSFHPERRITNLVFMGMGEPLHNFDAVERAIELLCDEEGINFSHRKITVSTAGLVSGIERLGAAKINPNLAISLNASDDATRDRLMPINRKWPIRALLDAVRAYPLERRRRVTFEYVLLAGVTDRDEDADRLGRLLRGLRCKVNIIPWNPHEGARFETPSDERVLWFKDRLRNLGLPVYVRRPRGTDIDAACGQLAHLGTAGRDNRPKNRAGLPIIA